MTTYLKVLSPDNLACHGGEFDYTDYLPQGDEPGPWLPDREPVLCASGWHWCTPESLMRHWAVANMRVYEAEPSADVTGLTDDGKCVSSSGRLLREYPLPEWWTEAMRFVNEELPNVPWMQRVGPVDPAWRVFPTLRAVRSATNQSRADTPWWRTAEYGAILALNHGRSAARLEILNAVSNTVSGWPTSDADLYAGMRYVCNELAENRSFIAYSETRWEVWRRGYGLYSDVDGVLHVYEKVV